MAAFVRLDNHIIRRRAEGITGPDDVGLFALLSVFLSIPDFKTPAGGLHAAVAKHCSNGRHTINAAWQHLSTAGYLKRTRLPDHNYRLCDIYTLQSRPDLSTPAVSHLSFAQSRHAWDSHCSFLPPTEEYTPISTEALMDARLSLAAKGLYAMIRQRLLLSAHVQGVTIQREGLRRSSGLGECAFRRIWRELRDTGYLTLTHVWDAEQKKMVYRYSLAEERTEVTWTNDTQGQDSATKDATQLTARMGEEATARASRLSSLTDTSASSNLWEPDEERPQASQLRALVKDQIEYDVLCTRDNPQPLLDCVVEVITRVLHMPPGEGVTIRGARYTAFEVQRVLSALDANEAEYAVQAVHEAMEKARAKGEPIRNVRAYLLSCLFTAKTDFATSLVY